MALFYRRHAGSAYGHRDWSQSLSIAVSGADLYKPLRYLGGHWLLSQGGMTLPLLLSSFWGTPSPTCVSKLCYQAHLCRCLIKPQLVSLLHARPESRGGPGYTSAQPLWGSWVASHTLRWCSARTVVKDGRPDQER